MQARKFFAPVAIGYHGCVRHVVAMLMCRISESRQRELDPLGGVSLNSGAFGRGSHRCYAGEPSVYSHTAVRRCPGSSPPENLREYRRGAMDEAYPIFMIPDWARADQPLPRILPVSHAYAALESYLGVPRTEPCERRRQRAEPSARRYGWPGLSLHGTAPRIESCRCTVGLSVAGRYGQSNASEPDSSSDSAL